MAEKTKNAVALDMMMSSFAMRSAGAESFVIVPDGYDLLDIERFADTPRRIATDHKFVSAKSFAQYLTRFSSPSMLLTASADKAKMLAVIDYHDQVDGFYRPSHGTHKATYSARLSDKIKAWLAICGRSLTQIEFGLFLEEHAVDVIQPEAAAIFEMVMQFEATKKVEFKSSQRLSDGSRQFSYVEENQSRGGLTLPDRIVVRAHIFEGMDPQDVTFLLRFRINEGSLRFVVEMHNKEDVMREAFERCVDYVLHEVKPEQDVYWVE
ncbi:MAG: DUF2303 family protein [Rhodobacteraceae bacterium]|nr:DUF2303 family protein [Paracoccaceae bacterium]